MDADLKTVIKAYGLDHSTTSIIKVETGHINDSYIIKSKSGNGFFLQRINHHVFKNINGLMQNIAIVLEHLNKKKSTYYKTMKLYPTQTSTSYFTDDKGNYWRLYNYIENSISYDLVTDTAIALEGGKAFGQFVTDLANLDAPKLADTIPNFHNMAYRLKNLENAVERDAAFRKKNVEKELNFVNSNTADMLNLYKLIETEEIPTRITHNDTKFNNILFDRQNRAICIVDLDTVMPGSLLFDFGDAIRTGANCASEDEADLDKVGLNKAIYESYVQGFIQTTREILTDKEKEFLAFSARYMAFIMGVRFLTDYLMGDTYYKIKYDEHNLQRAKVQFRFCSEMEKLTAFMESAIHKALFQ